MITVLFMPDPTEALVGFWAIKLERCHCVHSAGLQRLFGLHAINLTELRTKKNSLKCDFLFCPQELKNLIPKSAVGTLSANSSNVINLIIDAYNVSLMSRQSKYGCHMNHFFKPFLIQWNILTFFF